MLPELDSITVPPGPIRPCRERVGSIARRAGPSRCRPGWPPRASPRRRCRVRGSSGAGRRAGCRRSRPGCRRAARAAASSHRRRGRRWCSQSRDTCSGLRANMLDALLRGGARRGRRTTGGYDGSVASPNGHARISRIAIAPVKGLALQLPDEVELGGNGVAENRRIAPHRRLGAPRERQALAATDARRESPRPRRGHALAAVPRG